MEPNDKQPKAPFAKFFIDFMTEHFWIPKCQAGKASKHRTRNQHVMEMGNQEVRIMVLIIPCSHPQHDTRYTTNDKAWNKGKCPKHRNTDDDFGLVQCRQPVEYFYSRRYSNQHGRNRENRVHKRSGAHCKEMMDPDEKTEACNDDN